YRRTFFVGIVYSPTPLAHALCGRLVSVCSPCALELVELCVLSGHPGIFIATLRFRCSPGHPGPYIAGPCCRSHHRRVAAGHSAGTGHSVVTLTAAYIRLAWYPARAD